MVHVLSTALLLSSVVVLVIVLYLLDLSEGQAFNYIIDLTGATAAACIRSARSHGSLTTTALRPPPDNGGGGSTAASSCPAPSPGSCTGWTRGWVVRGRRWLCSGGPWPSWCPPSSSPTTERESERVTTDAWMVGPRQEGEGNGRQGRGGRREGCPSTDRTASDREVGVRGQSWCTYLRQQE